MLLGGQQRKAVRRGSGASLTCQLVAFMSYPKTLDLYIFDLVVVPDM